MLDKVTITERIDHLLKLAGNAGQAIPNGTEMYTGALQLAALLYGPDSHQVEAVKEIHKRITAHQARQDILHRAIMQELIGTLRNYKTEVEHGFITGLQKQAHGEVLADFIAFSKQALDAGSKDVAAVLSAAALEDCLKKFARSQGLDADDKDMSEVVNLLKSKQLLKQAEAKVAQSYVTFRNKAFHADWDKIGAPEVGSAIGFVENFLLVHFTA